MKHFPIAVIGLMTIWFASPGEAADTPAKPDPRQALQPFNHLIGSWKATGTLEGKRRDFWVETMSWEWQFKGDDAWLKVALDKGKYFTKGELRPLPEKGHYQLNLTTPGKETLSFEGALKDGVLTLDREDETAKESQRLVIKLLHANRFLYRQEVKGKDQPLFRRLYEVGATKEGEPFAGSGDNKPVCIVSGGLGKIPVTYKGQTYYVCCTGCRDAFKEDPEKYIKEAAQKAKEAKDKNR